MANAAPGIRRVLKKAAAYGAVFSLAFGLTLYWSFPYDLLADRVLAAVKERTGLDVTATSLRPWLLVGLKADGVTINRPGKAGREPLTVELASLAARLKPIDSLFGGTAVAFDAQTVAGHVGGTYQQRSEELIHLELDLDDVQLGEIPGLWDSLGLGFQGLARGRITATMPPGKLEQVNGRADLTVAGAKFGGGMISGFTVPAMDLGDLEIDFMAEDGKVSLDPPIAIEGTDLSARLTGTLELRPILITSKSDLELRFKPTDAFWRDNEKLAGLAQAMLKGAKGGDGWYTYQMGGVLGRPSFQAKRQ